MLRTSVFFALVAALLISFSPTVKAGVMDENEGSMMESVYSGDANKEFSLRSGYFYQKADRKIDKRYAEHGFSIGFSLARFLSEHRVFGADIRTSLRFEPDFMIGFGNVGDHTFHHLLAPVFLQIDFPMSALGERNRMPMEVSIAAGTGLLVYDLGDQRGRQNNMPVIGKVAFDYVRRGGLKMGVEAKSYYVINNPVGGIDDLWGISGVARVSFAF